MFLISDGTTGILTHAIVVERENEIEKAIRDLVATGVLSDQVVVNQVGSSFLHASQAS